MSEFDYALEPAPWSPEFEPARVEVDEEGRPHLVLLRGRRADTGRSVLGIGYDDVLVAPDDLRLRPGQIVWVDFSPSGKGAVRRVGGTADGRSIHRVRVVTDPAEIADRIAEWHIVRAAWQRADSALRNEEARRRAWQIVEKYDIASFLPDDAEEYPAGRLAAVVRHAGFPNVAREILQAAMAAHETPPPHEAILSRTKGPRRQAKHFARRIASWRPSRSVR